MSEKDYLDLEMCAKNYRLSMQKNDSFWFLKRWTKQRIYNLKMIEKMAYYSRHALHFGKCN